MNAPIHGRMSLRHKVTVVALLFGTSVIAFQTSALFGQNRPQPGAPGMTPGVAPEVNAAKRVIMARREYQASLEQIRALYANNGDPEKLKWAEDELKQLHRVPKHAYVLDLDVPGPGLKSEQNIPAANDLYRRALEYKDRGMGSDYLDNQIRAEILLQQLINQYPTSNKISDSAYHLGDIYESRVFRQYRRAAAYFERCFQWNPNTHQDARLRAARLYDKALNERGKAIELYKAVTVYETDPKRTQEAQRRLSELMEKAP